MKKYQRATRNELNTFLLRNNAVKTQPELFNDVCDADGKTVNPKNLSRQNELTGTGIEYLTSYVEYICTHFKNTVTDKSRLYYEAPPIEWPAFLDIVTGGISGLREEAERAVMQAHAKPKPILIQAPNGHYMSMQPFVITFDWGNQKELEEKAAARIAGLNKVQDGMERLPVKTISMLFSKPLFGDFFREGANNYSFPVGMYAKFRKEAINIKNSLVSFRENGGNVTDEELEVDQGTFISAYTRFARYIMLHNNLTGRNLKNKNHYSPLNFDYNKTLDFLTSVYPSAISTNGRRERRIDMPKFIKFLSSAIAFYRCIPNFLLYPILEHIDGYGFRLGIYTSMKAADKASKEKGKNKIAGAPPFKGGAVARL